MVGVIEQATQMFERFTGCLSDYPSPLTAGYSIALLSLVLIETSLAGLAVLK